MEIVYTALLNEEIAAMEIDTQTSEIKDPKVYGEKEGFSLVSQNKASAGWATNPVDCLEDKGKQQTASQNLSALEPAVPLYLAEM